MLPSLNKRLPAIGRRLGMDGGGGGSGTDGVGVTLPKLLQIDAGRDLLDALDATTGWGPTNGTIAVNATEFIEGAGSVKFTSNTTVNKVAANKTVNWDLSTLYPFVGVSAYIHTNLSEITSVGLFLYNDAGQTRFWLKNLYVPLSNGIWFSQSSEWTNGSGNASWAEPIVSARLSVTHAVGPVVSVSFDQLGTKRHCKPAAMIMFDDGGNSQLTYGFPVTQSLNQRATSYIISSQIDTGGAYMSSANLQTLGAAGWSVANHSATHPNFSTLNQAQIEAELTTCATFLNNLGLTQSSLDVAYPGGVASVNTYAALAAVGAKSGRTVENMAIYVDPSTPYYLPAYSITNVTSLATVKGWIDQAKAGNQVIPLLFHVLVPGAPASSGEWNAQDFADVCAYLVAQGMQTLTIAEYDQLKTQNITVNHK